jgi:hypothetical protein
VGFRIISAVHGAELVHGERTDPKGAMASFHPRLQADPFLPENGWSRGVQDDQESYQGHDRKQNQQKEACHHDVEQPLASEIEPLSFKPLRGDGRRLSSKPYCLVSHTQPLDRPD